MPLLHVVEDFTQKPVCSFAVTTGGEIKIDSAAPAIDTTTAAGKLVFGIFAALAEFERELIAERTTAGLASARARGRNGGRPYKMTPVKLRLAMASMGQSETKVSTLCQELGITRQTLYRHISPVGQLRADGIKLLNRG
ncbi:recombinase family protein [Escherichia coli]